ncbi:MAG: hypothetical protein AAF726_20430 [Planctomycetota bacterium]
MLAQDCIAVSREVAARQLALACSELPRERTALALQLRRSFDDGDLPVLDSDLLEQEHQETALRVAGSDSTEMLYVDSRWLATATLWGPLVSLRLGRDAIRDVWRQSTWAYADAEMSRLRAQGHRDALGAVARPLLFVAASSLQLTCNGYALEMEPMSDTERHRSLNEKLPDGAQVVDLEALRTRWEKVIAKFEPGVERWGEHREEDLADLVTKKVAPYAKRYIWGLPGGALECGGPDQGGSIDLLTDRELAELLRVSTRTLARTRYDASVV